MNASVRNCAWNGNGPRLPAGAPGSVKAGFSTDRTVAKQQTIAPMNDVIHLHLAAPAKPAPGQPCNGCGVCCAIEPCPVGIVVSRRRRGACDALLWNAGELRYRCGVATEPRAHLPRAMRWAAPMLARLALRYISAGSGCDCGVDVRSSGHGAAESSA